jgi:hypothetical protein
MVQEDGAWFRKWPKYKREALEQHFTVKMLEPSKVKAFIKREVGEKPLSKARLIQGYANFHVQRILGPFVTGLQEALCHLFDGSRTVNGISITIACGMNQQSLGDWMTETLKCWSCVFYERDGKNWDATMGRAHHQLKMSIYELIGDDQFLCRLIDAGFVCKGTVPVRDQEPLRYTLCGTTKSGHNDTSIGNSIVNAAIMYLMFLRRGYRGRIIVAGDDALGAIFLQPSTRRPVLEDLVKIETEYGITPEAGLFQSPYSVTFLSGCWYPSPHGFVFGPRPGRLLARLNWTVHNIPKRAMENYKRCVSASFGEFGQRCPILRAMLRSDYQQANLLSLRQSNRTLPYLRYDSPGDYSLIYDFILVKYGLSESEVACCENELRAVGDFPLVVSNPVLQAMSDFDLVDVTQRPETSY